MLVQNIGRSYHIDLCGRHVEMRRVGRGGYYSSPLLEKGRKKGSWMTDRKENA